MTDHEVNVEPGPAGARARAVPARDEAGASPSEGAAGEGSPPAGAAQESTALAGTALAGAAQAGASERASGPRRAARLVKRHKLGSALVALVVAAAIAGVASGSLKGPGSGGASSGPENTIVYSHPAAAAAFTLAALTGTPANPDPGHVSLSQYQGRPLIVNFFASWCEPCQRETPLLASFYKASHGRVALLGIDGNDSTGPADAFVKAKGVTYPVGVDPQLVLAAEYNVSAFPQTFFLNARHQVVYQVVGAVTSQELTRGTELMGVSAN
ncbi:MAG TPA: TlpA disulfide reductase family protein [Trebonia sp.]|nr:TlpA disulfide reductase family protein [Trebonia sp.]